MLTRAGWGVVAGSMVALATGRLFGITELYVLAAAGLAACAMAMVAVAATRGTVTVTRRMVPERMTAGHLGRIDLRVENRAGRIRLPCTLTDPVAGTLGVRLTIGPLALGETGTASYRIPTSRRGRVTVGPLRADVVDPLGLARRCVGTQQISEVVVLPRPLAPGKADRSGGWQEPSTGSNGLLSPSSSPAEVATLRPYVVGDDLRRVHWPSSAHSGDLQVRNDDQHWQGQVAVLLDTRRSTADRAQFEQLVSTAAGMIHQLATTGDQVRLMCTDGTDSGMVDARRAAPSLLEQLALVTQHDGAATRWPSPRSSREDRLLVVADPARHEDLAATLVPFGYATIEVIGPAEADAEATAHG